MISQQLASDPLTRMHLLIDSTRLLARALGAAPSICHVWWPPLWELTCKPLADACACISRLQFRAKWVGDNPSVFPEVRKKAVALDGYCTQLHNRVLTLGDNPAAAWTLHTGLLSIEQRLKEDSLDGGTQS